MVNKGMNTLLAAVILLVGWYSPVVFALYQEDFFDLDESFTAQGYKIIGEDWQELFDPGLGNELYMDTRSDPMIVSGIFGPTPDFTDDPVGSFLWVAASVIGESDGGTDDAVFSIIVTGPEVGKAIHIVVGIDGVYYFDANFNLIPIPYPSSVDSYVFPFLGSAISFPEEGILIPFVDYTANANSQHPSIAPIYSLTNTIFVGDATTDRVTQVRFSGMSNFQTEAPPALLKSVRVSTLPVIGLACLIGVILITGAMRSALFR